MIELIELKNPVSLEAVEKVERWRARNRIRRYYPDEGPRRRELYPNRRSSPPAPSIGSG